MLRSAMPLAARYRRASSGSNRGTMSGVCPWSAGGTTPPVATTTLSGTARSSASRSTACARARRKSTFDITGCAWSNPKYPDHAAGPSWASSRTVGTRSASFGVYRTVAMSRSPRSYGSMASATDERTNSTRRMLPTRAAMSFGCRSSVSRSSSSCDDPERAAHHLAARVRPRRSLGLDRVSRLRPAVGPVHDAHEVRRRSHQPEFDRPIVQRLHPHPVRVRVVTRGSSPGRSRARSRSPPTNRASRDRGRA